MSSQALDDATGALAEQLLAETREELIRADSKAATLFAVFGIAFGVVLAGILAGNWAPSDLAPTAEVVWWLGAVSAACAVTAVAAAVWPRITSASTTGRVTYFGHVVAYGSREALVEALGRQADQGPARRVEQLEALSAIVVLKYRLVQVALVLYGAGATACAAAALAS